ncbi:MAG: hypothetical protein K9M44_02760 [Candidatus Pacebacteria bacterium]|nr:hypothetical protein [Candidatus Paceibacterota bacterium]
MKNLKIFLISFLVFILLGAGFLFLYKNNLADIMQEKMSSSDEFLLISNTANTKIKEIDLETDLMSLSKYKKLETGVSQEFMEETVEVGRATSSSNYVKQLIFLKPKNP